MGRHTRERKGLGEQIKASAGRVNGGQEQIMGHSLRLVQGRRGGRRPLLLLASLGLAQGIHAPPLRHLCCIWGGGGCHCELHSTPCYQCLGSCVMPRPSHHWVDGAASMQEARGVMWLLGHRQWGKECSLHTDQGGTCPLSAPGVCALAGVPSIPLDEPPGL